MIKILDIGEVLDTPGLSGVTLRYQGWRRGENSIERGYHRLIQAELRDADPPIWRRFLIHENLNLDGLHKVLQVLFGWASTKAPYHLHQFEFGPLRFGVPDDLNGDLAEGDPEAYEERAIPINDLHARDEFTYRYDFGDNWVVNLFIDMTVAVDAETGKAPAALCIGGERCGPPENIGGIYTYNELIADLAEKPKSDARRLMGRNFKPEAFDLSQVNRKLAALRLKP